MSDGTPIIIKKKKHGGHGGHHGGSWKVAYADFVTAMMAFFMVMWIMGLSDKDRTIVQGYFNDPFGFASAKPSSRSVIALPGLQNSKLARLNHDVASPRQSDVNQLQKLKQTIESKISADKSLKGILRDVAITVTKDGLRIELIEATDAAFFQLGKATLNPVALGLIHHLGPLISQSDRRVVLEGHTDSHPYPSSTYNNWDLSCDRANALRRALQTDGVGEKQFEAVRGLADTELRIPSKPLDPRNRRVSILLPFRTASEDSPNLPKDELKSELHELGENALKSAG